MATEKLIAYKRKFQTSKHAAAVVIWRIKISNKERKLSPNVPLRSSMNHLLAANRSDFIPNYTQPGDNFVYKIIQEQEVKWHESNTTMLEHLSNFTAPLNDSLSPTMSSEIILDEESRSSFLPVSSGNSDEENFEEIFLEIQQLVAIVVPLCFGIIAVTGFFGNSLVILVVLFNKQMHSTTNLLIVNLAAADLLFVIFCVPFTATDYVTNYWPFGEAWCCTVQYLIVVTAFASIYTLVLMSIDRFLAVVHPIRSRMLRTEKITKIAIFTLWAVILTISTPVPISHGVVYLAEGNVTYAMCQFMQNEFVTQSAYQIIFLASSYLLPLMIISGLYVRMIMRLWRQGSGVRMSVESQRGRKRVTRLVVVVVIAFASLWLPVQLILMLKAVDLYHANTKAKVILQIVAQTLAYTSSCINPLLYAFLSDNFRKAFNKAIHCSKHYRNYTSDLPPPRRTSYARTSTTGL